MKIDGIGGQDNSQPAAATDRGTERPKSDRAAAPSADRVELSETARRMSSLIEAAGQLPDVREERVAALRKAIRFGTHQVEPRALARSILEFEDGLYR